MPNTALEKNRATYKELFNCEWDLQETSQKTPEPDSPGFIRKFFSVLKWPSESSFSPRHASPRYGSPRYSSPRYASSPRVTTSSVQSSPRPLSPKKRSLSPVRTFREDPDKPESGSFSPKIRRASTSLTPLNDTIEKPFNCGELFKNDQLSIFLANFNKITSDEALIEYIRQNNPQKCIDFLRKIQEDIFQVDFVYDIQENNRLLKNVEEQYQRLLIEKGLTKRFDIASEAILTSEALASLFAEFNYPNELVELLYKLCTGLDNEEKEFNSENIRHLLIGLMGQYRSVTILDILDKLLQIFKNQQQQLVALFMIKEIILWDHFHHIYRDKDVFYLNKDIPAPNCPAELTDFIKLLDRLAHFKRNTEPSLLETYLRISRLLAKSYVDPLSMPEKKDPAAFAKHLRAISLLYYQTLDFSVLTEEATRQGRGPISEQAYIFNHLSQYFTSRILNQPSNKQRIDCLTFYIRTLSFLLKDPADLNSATIIFSAIAHKLIARLKKSLFENLDKTVLEEWEAAKEILAFNNNYAKQRSKMTVPNALPYRGILTQDVIAIQELEFFNRTRRLGRIHLDLIQRQNSLRETFMPLDSALMSVLNIRQSINEFSLELMSAKIEPMSLKINLDDKNITLKDLEEIFDFYLKNPELTLTISYQNERENEKEGNAKIFFAWLEKYFNNPDLMTKALNILRKAENYFGSVLFNDYHTKLLQSVVSNEPILSQFQGKKSRVPLSTSAERGPLKKRHRRHQS